MGWGLGLAVLVVEDELLLTMLLHELLDELGCRVVATAMTLSEGITQAERDDYDIAILDVPLRGEPVWPLADRLRKVCRPFIIATTSTLISNFAMTKNDMHTLNRTQDFPETTETQRLPRC